MNCLPKKGGRCREVANRREGADSGEVADSGVLAVIEEVPGWKVAHLY